MRRFSYKLLTLGLASLFCASVSFGQSTDLNESYWNPSNLQSIELQNNSEHQIHARKANYFQMDFEPFYQSLLNAQNESEISLPIGDGFQKFVLVENSTMSNGLRENYPSINSYNIVSTDTRAVWGKIDVSHHGFHAMIFQPGMSTLFIDPVFHNEPNAYMVYHRADFESDKTFECHVTGHDQGNEGFEAKGNPYTDCVMNTYRFAVAATGEYTAFHGGEVADALAAQVVTMNRVNMVYERDFGVNFSIIPDNDQIVYDNAATDPYDNNNAGVLINQNQNNIDDVIGSANYDVGHVFSTGAGGLAGLGVSCSNGSKARGVTGTSQPINDPYDIDYVAHEVGHQFGGSHSFNNSCNGNRSNANAMEPGSGSTIMAYAGICAPNVQNNSDDYFHGVSMRQMGQQINSDNCQVVTDLGNTSPVLSLLPEEVLIPLNTPFILKASATDVDGDTLTYCWEQMDNDISDQPPAQSSTQGPTFRSFDPTVDSLRYFPDLQAGPSTWERLPSVPREMNFRVSVRDNAFTGGCTQYDDLVVVGIANTGPFKVQYPDAISIIWQAFEYETILWDVANTTEAPLNADLVDIFLSLDDGETYDIQIADDVVNDGSHTIQVPNMPTLEAVVMVINAGGTFFDVSNNDFTIEGIDNGFWFETADLEVSACQSETIVTDIAINQVGSFDEPITLSVTEQPENSNVTLSTTEVAVGETVTVTISDLSGTTAGVYELELTGVGTDFQNQIGILLTLYADTPLGTSLQLPVNESVAVETSTTLTWDDNASVGEYYNVELSTDAGFTDIVESATEIQEASYQTSNLDSETTYFWRVFTQNECGTSAASASFEFTTFTCSMTESESASIDIPAAGVSTFNNEIEISESAIIADVNVINVEGTHSRISDFKFTLTSPAGTETLLLSGACGGQMTLFNTGLEITGPSSIAGDYESSGASDFGGNIPANGITGNLVLANDGNATPTQMCNDAINPEEMAGNIAFITRGGCSFVNKVLAAQEAGAIAAIVANNQPGEPFFDMGGNSTQINIPSVMITYEDGEIIAAGLGQNVAGFSFTMDSDAMETIECPNTNGGTFLPVESLSVFNGENGQGIWTLKVEDVVDGEGGVFETWGLQLCYSSDIVNGVDERSGVEANIYPNPTQNQISVALSVQTTGTISMVDISGRIISQQTIQGQKTNFDLSPLMNGIYFVKIDSPEFGQSVYKVVKQ